MQATNADREESNCREGAESTDQESLASCKMQLDKLILLLFATRLAEQLPLPNEESKLSPAGKLGYCKNMNVFVKVEEAASINTAVHHSAVT